MIYQRVLVPLDGSELAECVLPHVESIGKGCGVKDVVLIRVVEPLDLPTRGASLSAMPSWSEWKLIADRKQRNTCKRR